MTGKRLEGKLVDIAERAWANAMPSPDMVQLAITEGVRLAMLEHLTGKPAPYLVDTNLPKFMQDDVRSGKLVPTDDPNAKGAAGYDPPPVAKTQPKAPIPAPPVLPAPPPAPPARQTTPSGAAAQIYTIANVSVSDNAQRYLNVKMQGGPRLRFYLNSSSQADEWSAVLVRFVLATGVVPDEQGLWETDDMVGRTVALKPCTGTISGLLQMQGIVP